MKTKFNRGVDVKAMAADLQGLEKSVLTVLQYSIGRDNAMSRRQLIKLLRTNPLNKDVDDRAVRLAIHELRQSGKALICSTGGIKGGYWLANGWEEVEEFIERELEPRAFGLLETKKAMLASAGRKFGPRPIGRQGKLF